MIGSKTGVNREHIGNLCRGIQVRKKQAGWMRLVTTLNKISLAAAWLYLCIKFAFAKKVTS